MLLDAADDGEIPWVAGDVVNELPPASAVVLVVAVAGPKQGGSPKRDFQVSKYSGQ